MEKSGSPPAYPICQQTLAEKANRAIDKWKNQALYNCRLKPLSHFLLDRYSRHGTTESKDEEMTLCESQ
jgi:hypothetical protein